MVPVSRIDAILQAEDIEGLLELGAPKDEYSHEAARITSELGALMPGDATEDRITAVVANVWARSFNLSEEDLDKRCPALRRVAQQIVASRLESARHT
jgi:hypothetical protein